MSNGNVDFNRLKAQADTLYKLIDDTNRVLMDPSPISNLQVDFERQVSSLAPKLAVQAQKMINKGKPEAIVVGTAVLAGGWVGAKVIDVVRNNKARSDARKALLGYYQQLASKQSLIIEEQHKINQLLASYMGDLQKNEAQYRNQIRTLQQRQAELSELLYRFSSLRTQVER